MLRIRLLHIGKTKHRWIQTGILHYQKEMKPFAKLDIEEVKSVSGRYPEAELMRREATRFKGNIDRGETVICLDRKGQRFTSEALARWLSSQIERASNLVFVIGGAYGIEPEFKRKSAATMSISPMTFTHDMVRLLFAEQLYRAMTILNNHPYHKDTPSG
jgi:23S rRNA (pseudouridine1915-N3)-methyltransferase